MRSRHLSPTASLFLIMFYLFLVFCQAHHCPKHPSTITIFLSSPILASLYDFFSPHVHPPPYVFTPTPALTMQTIPFLPTSCWSESLVRVEHCSFSSVLTSTPPLTLGVSVLRYGSTETPFGGRLDLLAFFVTQLEWKHIAKTKYARMLKMPESRVNFEIYCIRPRKPKKKKKKKKKKNNNNNYHDCKKLLLISLATVTIV